MLADNIPDINKITSTGGLTRIPMFNQLIADMIDCPINKCITDETTGVGAWINAVLALGLYPSTDDVFSMLEKEAPIEPAIQPDKIIHEKYMKQMAIRDYLRSNFDNQKLHSMFLNLRI